MLKGYVITHGRKAMTIQTETKHQYYGPMENIIDEMIFNLLENNLRYIPVKFMVDKTNYSGEIKGIKRYFAYNIESDIVI